MKRITQISAWVLKPSLRQHGLQVQVLRITPTAPSDAQEGSRARNSRPILATGVHLERGRFPRIDTSVSMDGRATVLSVHASTVRERLLDASTQCKREYHGYDGAGGCATFFGIRGLRELA